MGDIEVTTCDWCLRVAPVEMIQERLWRFWKIISAEDSVIASKNICENCRSRYEKFSVYIEMCKTHASVVNKVLATGQIKHEPVIEIEYHPFIKEEILTEVSYVPKTIPQRQKEFGEREKLSQQRSRPQPKSAAQRNKEYRERLKNRGPSEASTSGINLSRPPPKSASQRNREYRERLKNRDPSEASSATKSYVPKTDAQRQREYRERKKLRQLKSSLQKKTNAQRSKDYRERLKIKQLMLADERKVPRKKIKTSSLQSQNEVINDAQIAGSSKPYVPYIDSDRKLNLETYDNVNKITKAENSVAIYKLIEGEAAANKDFTVTRMSNNVEVNDADMSIIENSVTTPIYSNYYQHAKGHLEFINNFKEASYGHSCAICDRLWWKNDLKPTSQKHEAILKAILPDYVTGTSVEACFSCKSALDKRKVPLLSTYNGFTYPDIPSHLPELDVVSRRLVSPRVPFLQIRRLGRYGVYGQIINVPVSVSTMVHRLPRRLDDDHCVYVRTEKELVHNTSRVRGLVNDQRVKEWLAYLVKTPLYIHHDVTVGDGVFSGSEAHPDFNIDDLSEDVSMDVTAQQSLLWNEETFLHVARGGNNLPISTMFDEHAEELSFPTIYGGQFRRYRRNVQVSPFMQATSELRRTDRRGADPEHLLYLAIKIMRLRARDSIAGALKHAGTEFIPNSTRYWYELRRDLLATMRQKGPPTAFMTLRANETGWDDLLKLLHRLQDNGTELSQMSYVHKAELVSKDAVTCAIYFNKLVTTLLNVLQSKKSNPFGKYRVADYFERIEFRGGPRAHVLLWLENAPADLSSNSTDARTMIDELVSVSASEASGNIKLQVHEHTSACYKKTDPDSCRFGAPFMPSRETVTLFPMRETDGDYSEEDFRAYRKHFRAVRENLESVDYADFHEFYSQNEITSDRHYHQIIRAGIDSPKLFYKRSPCEKWHEPFNPFVFHHLLSKMDFQIIQDEHRCAAYLVEYFDGSNRGTGESQQKLIEVMGKSSGSDIMEAARRMSVDIVGSVEMSAQEAAWYLLRIPTVKSTIPTVYIPTVWPVERQRVRKTMRELKAVDDIWKDDWFDKYEKRPEELHEVSLAQFVSTYYRNNKGEYVKRKEPRVIKYRNYDKNKDFSDYMREMVLLYVPFRNEENDVLAGNRFIQIYEDNKDVISQRRKEFESGLDIEKTMERC